ncbi:sigma-70 family RNA polymerase sigma factor [Nannocystis pusilla]|uniref:Sigma-70 family RNA polymerase sigma factor n=1 Tax=Nannocystis pusilla TaxID=889268 RepID=A0A9X3ETQ8_9BACT|nr:sigma-70 family RNA polymerase sigma factor [Nannocystis pusilla]MCY1009982.1 sigma-70 family RNA polymerase sigma factor [Nannocystis pusilla]
MSRRMTRDPKFAAIYSEHAAHVWRLARHFGVPPEQLHDVAQEVWVSVFRQLESLDLSRPLKPWLTAVVWNHVRHLRRGYARHMRKAQALTDAEAVRGGGEEPMSRSEAVWTLEMLLSELPADQREVLLLCDGEGLSAPEVSEALGAPLNTVYSRLRLARRRCQAFAATLGAAGWALLIQRHCVELGPSPGELERLGTALGSPMAGAPAAVGAATGPRSWLGAAALVASVVAAGALAAGLWQMQESREAAAAEPAAGAEWRRRWMRRCSGAGPRRRAVRRSGRLRGPRKTWVSRRARRPGASQGLRRPRRRARRPRAPPGFRRLAGRRSRRSRLRWCPLRRRVARPGGRRLRPRVRRRRSRTRRRRGATAWPRSTGSSTRPRPRSLPATRVWRCRCSTSTAATSRAVPAPISAI